MRAAFYGGVHPQHAWPEKHVYLEDSGSYSCITPARVYLPMRQGPGAASKPMVEVGQTVAIGQLVGGSDEKLAAPVHASVSGTVREIREHPLPGGKTAETIIIENDFTDTIAPGLVGSDIEALTAQDVLRIVRGAGILGMGGAAFPSAVKLDTREKTDTLIVNGCECEPMLAADDAVMQRNPGLILLGCAAAVLATGAARAIIAIEGNKPAALSTMETAVQGLDNISVQRLGTCYPQGGEKQLIQALTGREVPIGGLPSAVGVVMLNAATCAAIGNAVKTGLPLVQRVATVTGDVKQPRNVLFPIGTPAGDLIDACGGFAGAPSKVVIGGPMMGQTIETLETPMLKGSNGLVAVNAEHDGLYPEFPCIRCGRCATACPMRLMPMFLDRAYRDGKVKWYTRFKAQACIGCGCCSYVCPTRRRLAQHIMLARDEVLALQKEAKSK